MSNIAEKIMTDALQLSAEERSLVAEKLMESLDEEVGAELSPAWQEEIRRRCKEVDEGRATLRSAEEVFARARALLG